jgi:hypothetical protein
MYFVIDKEEDEAIFEMWSVPRLNLASVAPCHLCIKHEMKSETADSEKQFFLCHLYSHIEQQAILSLKNRPLVSVVTRLLRI